MGHRLGRCKWEALGLPAMNTHLLCLWSWLVFIKVLGSGRQVEDSNGWIIGHLRAPRLLKPPPDYLENGLVGQGPQQSQRPLQPSGPRNCLASGDIPSGKCAPSTWDSRQVETTSTQQRKLTKLTTGTGWLTLVPSLQPRLRTGHVPGSRPSPPRLPLTAATSPNKADPNLYRVLLGSVTTGLGCFLGKHCPKPAANAHGGWGVTMDSPQVALCPRDSHRSLSPPPTLTPHPCPTGLHGPSCPLQSPRSPCPRNQNQSCPETPHGTCLAALEGSSTMSSFAHGPAITFLQRKRCVTCAEGSRLHWELGPKGRRPRELRPWGACASSPFADRVRVPWNTQQAGMPA